MVSYEELLTLPALEAGKPGMSTAPSLPNSNPQYSWLQKGGGVAVVVGWGGQVPARKGSYLHVGMPWDLVQGDKPNNLHVLLGQILQVVLLLSRDGHRLLAILYHQATQLKPPSARRV